VATLNAIRGFVAPSTQVPSRVKWPGFRPTLSAQAAAILWVGVCVTAPAHAQTSAVLDRARAYAVEYERQFSSLVAEERYVQEVRTPRAWTRRPSTIGGPSSRDARQELRSTYLIVAGEDGFVPFRDVFEVNGTRVHDRVDRLTRLFQDGSGARLDLARQIMIESARHNIGPVERTINIPVLAMLFLLPRHAQHFEFASEKTERVNGRPATVVRFAEVGRPTLIKTGTPPSDMPSSGRVWIETSTGRVLRTEHDADAGNVRATVMVDFREDKRFPFLVPDRMQEVYRIPGVMGTVRGVATYSNYQRVQVDTDEKIAVPKKPPPSMW
jgi:hypothetical protein